MEERKVNPEGYRVIKTARSLEAMNEAAKKGFRPLVKKVEPSEEIKSKYTIFQHKETGEVEYVVDARAVWRFQKNRKYVKVIDRTFFYPYNFESPIAAYLVPKDLKKGDFVYLEDLIEDLVDFEWNQGVSRRLTGCEAIWDGEDFKVLYTSKKAVRIMG